jgi:hypothetical protein
MSKLRPECGTAEPGSPCARGVTAYAAILNSVECQDGLIHGRLHFRGAHCAIGSFFEAEPHTSLPTELVDEVAMINDSCPTFSTKKRKQTVMRWLRWKLRQLGYPLPGRPSKA